MISFVFKVLAGILLLFILGGFLRTWQLENSDMQKKFIAGTVPNPLPSGLYNGQVPGHKFSWIGKNFDDLNNVGINVFDDGKGGQEQKYPFVTSVSKGIRDQSLDVLKIDYDTDQNPFWLRFILDEVVETEPGQYLGKLQVRFIWKHPFTLGFFTLKKSGDNLEQDGNKTYKVGNNTFQTFWNADLGVSFSYRLDPNGYKLIEVDAKKINDSTLEKYFRIVNKKTEGGLASSTIATEWPPEISVMIFKNPENKEASAWLKDHGTAVNYKMTANLLGVNYGGTNGVRYSFSGLYNNDAVVLQNNYRIYVFTGTYDAEADTVRADFLDFIKTINLF